MGKRLHPSSKPPIPAYCPMRFLFPSARTPEAPLGTRYGTWPAQAAHAAAAQSILSGMAEDPFGGPVPEGNQAPRVHADDGIMGGLCKRPEALLTFPERFLRAASDP